MPRSKKICSIVILTLLISACAVGQVEDPNDPQVPEGAGFFSGERGETSLTDFFSEEAKAKRAAQYSDSSDINMPAIDETSFVEFEEFKAWRRAQEPGSENYQEYQDWRAYQQYLRYKTQQEKTPQP